MDVHRRSQSGTNLYLHLSLFIQGSIDIIEYVEHCIPVIEYHFICGIIWVLVAPLHERLIVSGDSRERDLAFKMLEFDSGVVFNQLVCNRVVPHRDLGDVKLLSLLIGVGDPDLRANSTGFAIGPLDGGDGPRSQDIELKIADLVPEFIHVGQNNTALRDSVEGARSRGDFSFSAL